MWSSVNRYINSSAETKCAVGALFAFMIIKTSEQTEVISYIAIAVLGQFIAWLPNIVHSLSGLVDPNRWTAERQQQMLGAGDVPP